MHSAEYPSSLPAERCGALSLDPGLAVYGDVFHYRNWLIAIRDRRSRPAPGHPLPVPTRDYGTEIIPLQVGPSESLLPLAKLSVKGKSCLHFDTPISGPACKHACDGMRELRELLHGQHSRRRRHRSFRASLSPHFSLMLVCWSRTPIRWRKPSCDGGADLGVHGGAGL
jgi:hypothetical protein